MQSLFSEEIDHALHRLWEYMQLQESLEEASCIVGLGCYNRDIPVWAAELYHRGYAPKVLFSGGLGRNTKNMWTRSEAEHFAEIAVRHGVPERDILLENKSTNTAENILFTQKVLEENGITSPSLLVIHKPYMQRRVKAAWGVYWPDCSIVLTSYPQTMEEYFLSPGGTDHSFSFTANMIVGDFQRILLYPEKGFQLPQEVPAEVMDAYEFLMDAGFTRFLVK